MEKDRVDDLGGLRDPLDGDRLLFHGENVAFCRLARSHYEGHRCVPGSSQAYGATLTTPGVALMFTGLNL